MNKNLEIMAKKSAVSFKIRESLKQIRLDVANMLRIANSFDRCMV